MKKRFLSLLLAIVSAFCIFTSCTTPNDGGNSSNVEQPQQIDYAAQIKLDMNSETLKQVVTLEQHIDGDTSHFKVPTSIVSTGKLKARYLAVNTPESTGKIEEWGKKASKYTKERLTTATSILIETNGTEWEVDSTGERYLVWVWYKSSPTAEYRCLNIELLQNGLAVGSKTSETRYGETCILAIDQAVRFKLHVHSQEKDPDFYYGAAIPLDLRELSLNKAEYLGQRVAFEGIITQNYNNGVYVENYDEETKMSYGIYVYYGYDLPPSALKFLQAGFRVRIVGELGDQFGYQISGLTYNPYDKTNPEHIQKLEENVEVPCRELDVSMYLNQAYTITFMEENEDGEATSQTITKSFLELAESTHISMKNLYVKSAYTTSNGGSNDGAITLTCEVDGKTVVVRTAVLKDADGNVVPQSTYVGKTIDVTGVVDYYEDKDQYQLMVFSPNDIIIH